MQIVELFGLPGAGKTTLVSGLSLPPGTVQREDLARGRSALSRGQLVQLILTTIADWRWVWALAVLAWQTPIWHREGLGRLVRLAVFRTWMRQHGRLLVLDQGPIQALWSIFFTQGCTPPPRRALVRVISLLYAEISVTLCELAVQPDLAATRITSRETGNSRLDGLPLGITRRKLETSATLPDALLAATRQAGIVVHSLPGDKTPEQLRHEVQALVDKAAAMAFTGRD